VKYDDAPFLNYVFNLGSTTWAYAAGAAVLASSAEAFAPSAFHGSSLHRPALVSLRARSTLKLSMNVSTLQEILIYSHFRFRLSTPAAFRCCIPPSLFSNHARSRLRPPPLFLPTTPLPLSHYRHRRHTQENATVPGCKSKRGRGRASACACTLALSHSLTHVQRERERERRKGWDSSLPHSPSPPRLRAHSFTNALTHSLKLSHAHFHTRARTLPNSRHTPSLPHTPQSPTRRPAAPSPRTPGSARATSLPPCEYRRPARGGGESVGWRGVGRVKRVIGQPAFMTGETRSTHPP
jgi:hypothetical protein